jgi:hypothetical protein
MTEPDPSDQKNQTLIDYARRKFAEERWPLSPTLRPVRAIMEKLDPKPEPQLLPAQGTRVEPSWRLVSEEAGALNRKLARRSVSSVAVLSQPRHSVSL